MCCCGARLTELGWSGSFVEVCHKTQEHRASSFVHRAKHAPKHLPSPHRARTKTTPH